MFEACLIADRRRECDRWGNAESYISESGLLVLSDIGKSLPF
jgi:hypothetical protein